MSGARGGAVWSAAFLMVLCCAVGPAVLGAVLGSAVGGWLGIACAVLVSAIAALVIVRRRRDDAC